MQSTSEVFGNSILCDIGTRGKNDVIPGEGMGWWDHDTYSQLSSELLFHAGWVVFSEANAGRTY